MFFVYVLQSQVNGRYYIGSTKDVAQRLAQHNSGINKSTRYVRPWTLMFTENFATLAEARRREQAIKAWKSPEYMKRVLGL